jgi:hypothetical protein
MRTHAFAPRRGGYAYAFLGAGLLTLSGCGETSSDDPGPGGAAGAGTGGDSGGESAGGAAGSSADAAGGAAGTAGAPDRPPAPPWTPHFDLGAPGWRDSREALCTEHFGLMGSSVWSDNQAVFTLVRAFCNELAGYSCDGVGRSLYTNAGDGWRAIHTADQISENARLSGFWGGDLIIYNDDCGISLVDRGGVRRCSASYDELGESVLGVATVGSAGYALVGEGLFTYDAPGWREFASVATPFGSGAIGAGQDLIVVAAYQQFVARGDAGGAFAVIQEVPVGDYTSVWVSGPEIWLANTAGHLVRFDGQRWTTIDTGINEAIYGLWGGADGVLYFHGQQDFGRWKEGAVELFAIAPEQGGDIQFTSIWGNSANEVFLSVLDTSFRQYQCSGVFMVWFDGSEFHVF